MGRLFGGIFPDFCHGWPRSTGAGWSSDVILVTERGGRDLDDVFFLGGGVSLRAISVEVSVGSGRCLVEFLNRFFVLCGNDNFSHLGTRRIFGDVIGDTWQPKCETTAGVQWVWQLAVTPGNLGFTAQDKDRDRSTGFLDLDLRFASGKETFSFTLIFWFFLSRETWGTGCRWLGDRLRNSHSAVVLLRRVVGRELMIRTFRKPRLRTYIAAEYTQTFGTWSSAKGSHILPHTEVVESGNDPFREEWSVKSKDQGRSRDHFPLLLPSDPVTPESRHRS